MIEINNRINELLSIIKNKKTIIALKNQAIKNLKQKLADKSKKSIKKTKNDKRSINSETKSDVLQIDTKKAVKIIVLFNSNEFTEKSEPRINNWALKIENKLRKNVSLFSIENVRIEYVQNLIDDQTLHHLKSRFRQKFKNSYAIVEDFIENLRRMYDDFNRRFTTVNQFRDLKMKKNNFIDFWTDFQRLFEKFEFFENHFFEKFIHKLTSIYQKHLSMKCDKIINVYHLAILIKKTIEKWKIAENIEIKTQRYRIAMNVNNTKSTDVQISMKANAFSKIMLQFDSFNRSLTSFVFRMTRTPNSDFIKKKTMIERRCFNCNEIEHIVKNCLKPKMIKINEIVKKMKFDENSKKK